MPGIDRADLDMLKLSQILRALLGSHAVNESIYERRLQLTGGEDNHGFELWRSLYQECQGGAEHAIMAGLRRFLRYPKCPHKSKIQSWLGEWLSLRRVHGTELPETHLYWMLIDMLPEDIAVEIRDRRQTLNTVDKVVYYIMGKLARYRAKEIASLHGK